MDTENNRDDKYSKFVRDAKEYIELQSDMLRLNLVEKLSLIISYLVVMIIGLFLGLAAFVYFSMAFVFWLGTFFNSLIPGFLIMGGIFVLILVLFFIMRKRLLLNPIIRKMSAILFNDISNEEGGNE